MIPALLRIDRRSEEYAGTFTLHLSADDGGALPEFMPGQFNMLYAFGTGEVAISMSGSPTGDKGYVHTVRVHGLATQALGRLREGEQIGVRGPFGQGWPLDQVEDRDLLIIAGGLGLAPLRPLIYSLLNGNWKARRVRIFYGARRPEERLYREELPRWSEVFELRQSVDHADTAWPGHIGVITGPLQMAEVDIQSAMAFICGPEIMMRFCIQALRSKGVAESNIYLSMERNMKCAIGHCGHCQWGPNFICKDGPVFCYRDIQSWFQIRAL
ncbi:FAD/NAD(P)-binding protein [Microbulbifer hainanensis]|uniref:FAD/NAD(P)-binding protein n=1 Tax=Microbulbifer hainanensis TaxID=2735675 RepID=UPI001866EE11|nr:FAD/NAD(P)-binding protein [Microbulbifer hainanensis]